MKSWKTLSRRKIFEQAKFLTLELHEVELPDGRTIRDWPWLITPDYVDVLAETVDGKLLFFRQTKYAVDGVTLSAVGGFIEPGESPEAAAQRELREETGYTASEWFGLGSFAVDANRGAGKAHFFLARKAQRVAPPIVDDLEEQELILLTRAEADRALAEGQFKVLAWTTVVALGLRRLDAFRTR